MRCEICDLRYEIWDMRDERLCSLRFLPQPDAHDGSKDKQRQARPVRKRKISGRWAESNIHFQAKDEPDEMHNGTNAEHNGRNSCERFHKNRVKLIDY